VHEARLLWTADVVASVLEAMMAVGAAVIAGTLA
jgi:hypothetical protein